MYDGSVPTRGYVKWVVKYESWFVRLSHVDSICRRKGEAEVVYNILGRSYKIEVHDGFDGGKVKVEYLDFGEAIRKCSSSRPQWGQMISGSVIYLMSGVKEIESR